MKHGNRRTRGGDMQAEAFFGLLCMQPLRYRPAAGRIMAAGRSAKEPAHLSQPDFPDEFQADHRSQENPGGFLLGERLDLEESPPGLGQRPGLPNRLGISSPFPPDVDVIAKIATAHLF